MVTGLSVNGQARGWRGLIPLHSTRAEVARLLGQPTEVLSERSVFYRTVTETVIISYTNGRPCGIGEKYSQWRVPRDTVESILVTPTEKLPLSELAIDESKYQKRSGGHLSDDVYYINDDDGVTIRVFMGDVMSISIYPGRIDSAKSCFPTAPVKDCEGLLPPPFDSYGNVALWQERLQLDNFGTTLLRNPDTLGYIIAYGGRSARVGEANALAERAKSYLVKIRKLPIGRLKIINGGFQEERTVELYVVASKDCPPVPRPTVDPRDLQMIDPQIQEHTP